jgi:hypothetical protein
VSALAAGHDALARGRSAIGRAAAAIESWPVPRVLGALVVVEWLAVLALARTARHAGWIYYQGGDQLWHYTLAWLLGHGQLTQTLVGYGWPFVLAPIAWIAGPNLVTALPAIVLLNVLVLLPVAMFALYGIAARIGGRLFGYWTLAVWIAAPFIGIRMVNAGYHERYTDLTLPQSFGLTAMSDFPTMVAAVVSMYFVAKVVLDRNPQLVDAVAGGVAAGAAIAVKPATALFLAGPALAFAVRRRLTAALAFVAGLAPAVLALAVWKERGLGHVPVLGSAAPTQVAAGAIPGGATLGGLDFHRYFRLESWDQFLRNLDLLREHFWSGRLIEWLVVAGLIALGRRSRPGLALAGGTLAAFVIVKGGYAAASVEDSSVFRIMMPSFPAFVLLLASLPLLFPRAPRALRPWRSGFASPAPRVRSTLVGAAVALSALVPLGALAAADRNGDLTAATVGTTAMPVPANVDIGLTATVRGRRVALRWRSASSFGGPVFYRVWRSEHDALTCPPVPGARICTVEPHEVGVSRTTGATDTATPGTWSYRVAVAANWRNDPGYGDPYLLSRPVTVTVR